MSFRSPLQNTRPPRPEHIEGVLNALADGDTYTPQEIAKRSGLSLTAVSGAVNQLAKERRVVAERSGVAKMRVRLP